MFLSLGYLSMVFAILLSANNGGEKFRSKRTLLTSLVALCAALYAVAIAATSPIPTPWGVGHFRPGVIVPAVFAVVFGPIVGGLGAAIGCFIGDLSLTAAGLTDPILSLIAGVPGNFVGFYLMGWFSSKYRSWRSFIIGSFVSLIVGNLVAAGGVVGYLSLLIPDWASWPLDVKFATVLGFTLFWVTTMLPFLTPLVPVLVRAVEPISKRVGVGVDASRLSWGKPFDVMASSALVALILFAIYFGAVFTPMGDALFAKAVEPQFIFWVKALILFAASVMFVFGVVVSLILSRQLKTAKAKP